MMAELPSEAKLRKEMEKLVPTVDVDTITTKQFIALLSKKMGGVDLSQRKKFIKLNLGEIIDSMDKGDDDNEGEDSSSAEESSAESESEEEEVAEPPKKKSRGLTATKEISAPLAALLGQGNTMARTEVVKALWVYIRENDLQNPKDRREILLDDAMRQVFGVDKFTMFSMNKYVGAHIYPFKPVDLTPKEKVAKKPKKGAAKKGAKKSGKKSTSFQAPYRLSPDLAKVVGTDILPRPQVTKGLWEYIRKHGLQNPEDKRQIICDSKFQRIMDGNKKVTMFSMNKHISAHLIEKVDKSLYTPPVVEEKEESSDSSDSEEDKSSESDDDGDESSESQKSDDDSSKSDSDDDSSDADEDDSSDDDDN